MKPSKLFSALLIGLAAFQQAAAAPEYISNFISFPAYPYNTSGYKQGNAFVGCGPTTGAMMFGYFQAVYSLPNLLTNPGTGVDKGLNTAWALHGSSYMKTLDTGFGSVYDIKSGLEKYASDKGYDLEVMIHVSPLNTDPNNPTWCAYGPFGDAWTNDAPFFVKNADNTWKIDTDKFCDFMALKLPLGIPIFLTIDSDGNGDGDHWVPLVGYDRATKKYAFYNTYTQTLQWADIYYVLDPAGHKINSISMVRTVTLSLPDVASNPSSWNYGSISVGGYSDKTFVISNAGTAALNVTAMSLSGTNPQDFGIQSGGGSFSLAAGATRNVVVRFTPGAAGARSASLSIASNDPDENPFLIGLSGTGTAASPDIASNAALYSYGSLNVGNAREFIFIISNTGGSNLNVTATTLTGANASEFIVPSGGGAFTLAPGATRNLVVRFVPADAGDKTATLSIASNDPDENPFLIALDGKGIAPDIASNVASRDFGSVSVGSWQERTVSISNVGSATLNVTGVTLTGANASEFSIQSGGGAFTQAVGAAARNIVLRFTPAGAGSKTATLSIASDDPDENPFLVTLTGTGTTAAPDIACSPSAWSYGGVNIGENSGTTFNISNTGNADLNVASVTLTGPNASEFSIESGGGSFTLAPGAGRDIKVLFSPTTVGEKSALLNLSSNDPDENPFTVSLVARGAAPDIASDPASGNFLSVNLGSAREVIFTISNSGTSNLIVSATTLTGANVSEFIIPSGGGAFTLAPGATRNIVVRFTPAGAGAKSASLRISSNDPDENPFLIGLSGTATAPDIAGNPSSWNYGSIILGSYSDKTFVIGNEGTSTLLVSAVTLTGANASEFSIQSGGGAFTVAVGATRNITVRFSPVSAGSKGAALSINSDDPDEYPFLIGLGGTATAPAVVPDIAVDPASWDFGSVSLGGYSEKTFAVSNAGTADLSVTATTLSGTHASDFSIQSGGGAFTLAPDATRNIVVRFNHNTAAAKSASLNIASNDPDENPLLIALTGFVQFIPLMQPDIACDPTSWNYGSVNVGSHFTMTFSVSNEGNANLNVAAVTLIGSNASEFSIQSGTGTFTLAAGAVRGLEVLFSPTSTGDKSASLSISSNDPNENPFEVNLSGRGIDKKQIVSDSVLWDLTHGVYGGYEPSGGYGNLVTTVQDAGYKVNTTADIGSIDLSKYKVLVVCLYSAWYGAYSAGEVSKIQTFVQNGGGLFLMGDNPVTPVGNINSIAQAFGVTLAVSEFAPGDITDLTDHPIFNGVSKINFIYTGELAAASPSSIIAWNPSKKGAVAVAQSGSGRVVVVGDLNFCENSSLSKADNQAFSVNIFNWLSKKTGIIVVDGQKDAFYSALTGPENGYLQLRSYAYNENGKPSSDADLSAKIWTAWDDRWFYLYEEVRDDVLSGSAPDLWDEDCLEMKFDPQPTDSVVNSVWETRLTALGKAAAGVIAADSMNNVPANQKQWVRSVIPGGYTLELALEWPVVKSGTESILPAAGNVFGMAINQQDNDAAGHEATVQWAAVMSDRVWNTPKYLGTVKFLPDHRLQFTAKNNMTGKTNPIPYDGSNYTPTAVDEAFIAAPERFHIEQNYPNPFNPSTRISFSVFKTTEARLEICDLLGRKVRTFVKSQCSPGIHEIKWDGLDENGQPVGSGIYIYTLFDGNETMTKKMLKLE